MKKQFLLLTAFLCIFSGIKLSAQVMGIDVIFGAPDTGAVPVNVCTGNSLNIWTGTNFTGYSTGETAQIVIDWGDGTSTTQTVTFNCNPGGCNYTPNQFTHAFTTTGVYTTVLSFTDTHGNSDVDSLEMHVSYNCGTIYTNVRLDTDNNGTGDIQLTNVLMDYTGATSGTTNFMLSYQASNMAVNDNPYTLGVNAGWLAAHNYIMAPTSPATQTVNYNPSMPWVQLPSFIVQCDPSNPSSQTDLAINYMGGWGFRAGQNTGYLQINVSNLTCSGTQNANLSVTFDPLLTYFSSDIPGGVTVTGNILTANVNVTGTATYMIYFSVPGGTPVPTPLNFSASLMAVGTTDFDPANNSATCVSAVQNSWDPNDKSVNKPEIISPNVRDEFTYIVRFQNMGNDEAYDIVIKDTLDTDLDLSTFSLVELSHNGFLSIDPATRIATFNFPAIHLPAESQNEPASHGYVVYKIKENVSAPVGTAIKNTAYIYFDQNPAVVTNTTFNINQTMGVEEVSADNFAVFPVPATDGVTIKSQNGTNIESVKLVDVTGKTVLNVNAAQPQYTLNLQAIANGVYTLVVQTEAGVVNKKIVIRK